MGDHHINTTLIFFANGVKVLEPNPDPEWTLLGYLRYNLRLCGTRGACQEGGCGACTVMQSKYDPRTNKIRNAAINACITPLCTVHGTSIVTVEGLGSLDKGLHPVQERIAKSHGTQCGFCTPGFVMSMYALLRNNPTPTEQQLEEAFQSNLCRCTGYRPILDGFKSFCSLENCCRKERNEVGDCNGKNRRYVDDLLFQPSEFKPYDKSQDPIFPPELKMNHADYEKALKFHSEGSTWYRRKTLVETLELKSKHPDGQLVGGGTDINYQKKFLGKKFSTYIQLPELPEMMDIKLEDNHLVVGSCAKYAELISFCRLRMEENLLLKTLSQYFQRYGGCQLRNTATIGGSIASGSIASDSITVFSAADATVRIASKASGVEEVRLDQNFFRAGGGTNLKSDQIITLLRIPLLNKNEFIWAYKVSRRKDVDVAILNAAAKVRIETPSKRVTASKFVFNGLALNGITFATSYSAYINERIWNQETAEGLLQLPTHTFGSPTDQHISLSYRQQLVIGLLSKFTESLFQWTRGELGSSWSPAPRHSTQLFEIVPEEQPAHDLVGRPIAHLSGLKHATGEAVFLADLPPTINELRGALVLSTRARAKIISRNYEAALAIPGVIKIFDWKSFERGSNRFYVLLVKDEVVFAEEEVEFYGQLIAFVVAETQAIADRAAQAVHVAYEDIFPRILTIDDAINSNSCHDTLDMKIGNVEEGFEGSDDILEGEFHTGGQKHFAMEPNGSLAIPKEDNEIEIIATTQAPKIVQSAIAQCLGVPASDIVVKMRRIGGGFGGRETRPCLLSVCTALAARKLKRPVRCILTRQQDLQLMGGRHPTLFRYKVGFSNSGAVNAIKADVYMNGGHTLDYSSFVLGFLMRGLVSMYKVPNWDLHGTVCRTNTHSSTAFRGFGNPQASLMMENIMDAVTVALQKSQMEVRRQHFQQNGDILPFGFTVKRSTIQRCWDECIKQADLATRQENVKEFNEKNRHVKRGLAVTPLSFPIGFPVPFLNQGGALVMVYDDGSVSLNHGGCEMGQGLHTKMMQVASRALGIPVSKIRIQDTATDKVPNTTSSAASMTADLNGPAIIDACEILLKRLEPIKAANPTGKWEDWISKAFFSRVNLSAVGFNKLDFPGYLNYLSYAAGVSEVEIDCLTGEHQVLRTDIVMDVGESLNPAIDVGQIEGAFMQGCGFVTTEEVLFSAEGQLLATGPSTYKIPNVSTAPRILNVSLLRGAPNDTPKAVYSSKGVGEPALLLGSSVFYAIKDAIRAAREDKGLNLQFPLDSPATVQRIKTAIEGL